MIDKVIKTIVDNRLSDLHTSLQCKITKLSPLSVKPTSNRGNIGDYPELEVTRLEDFVPAVGDKVLVIFTDRALDNVGSRKHDLSDGVIIGKLV